MTPTHHFQNLTECEIKSLSYYRVSDLRCLINVGTRLQARVKNDFGDKNELFGDDSWLSGKMNFCISTPSESYGYNSVVVYQSIHLYIFKPKIQKTSKNLSKSLILQAWSFYLTFTDLLRSQNKNKYDENWKNVVCKINNTCWSRLNEVLRFRFLLTY